MTSGWIISPDARENFNTYFTLISPINQYLKGIKFILDILHISRSPQY